MLGRKQKIEELKFEKVKKNILSHVGVEGELSLECFLSQPATQELMGAVFKKALDNEVGKYNFSRLMQEIEGAGEQITNEEKVRVIKNFVSSVHEDRMIFMVWEKMALALEFNRKKFGKIASYLEENAGDMVVVSKNCKKGICFLEEENFTRFSKWG